jgi:alpha-D-ribose 1-methylphosphonate 5-triphosphate synthase subunit PhnH
MLAPAFADPVHDSQRTFRAVMNALAHPGAITPIVTAVASPLPLAPAAAAIALTLLDYETPVWLDGALAATPGIADWFRFHTGASITSDQGAAAFAFIADVAEAPSFETFALGSTEYPDRSTTLVLQVEQFSRGESISLRGPGIAGTRTLAAGQLPSRFREQWADNRELFPRGVDVILVTNSEIVALPRSVRILTD